MMKMTTGCVAYELGLVEYSEAYLLQRRLLREKLDGETTDALLLLEHPPTFTIGKSGKLENLLGSRERLSQEAISVFFVDRGGDVTYHGPGQLVGYPIVDLRKRGRDVQRYVRDLEEVILRTLSGFSIDAYRDPSHPGVWVENEEVASIGLSFKKWVSMHGFAVNVNPNLEHFSLINPCGFSDRKATSISKLLSKEMPLKTVAGRLMAHFSEVFEVQLELRLDSLRTGLSTRPSSFGDLQNDDFPLFTASSTIL